jgi:hypothetical protein
MASACFQIAPVQEDQPVFIRSLIRTKPDTSPASRAQPGPDDTVLELLLAAVFLLHVFSPCRSLPNECQHYFEKFHHDGLPGEGAPHLTQVCKGPLTPSACTLLQQVDQGGRLIDNDSLSIQPGKSIPCPAEPYHPAFRWLRFCSCGEKNPLDGLEAFLNAHYNTLARCGGIHMNIRLPVSGLDGVMDNSPCRRDTDLYCRR